ncbi:hypothetical protein COV93_00355 [Candidatus Woesearchaeota archaeon CG11_big_fil_rev_8_21_14_0_20_43_8]|nr:MAG: hypothetical protein COV93_00355 [Candidatus Woesearchaeota archaeon CG11_big_fil_rev_8_21_14_0_20_43_8]
MNMKLTVVLPAYNEGDNVEELTTRLVSVLKKQKIKYDILYILQGNDGALERLRRMKKKIPQIRMKHYPEPLGVGPAFRIGFDNIAKDSTHVLTLDADLNHQPEEIPRFIRSMEKNKVDLVIGSRKVKGGKMIDMPVWKKWISSGTNMIFREFFNLGAKDLTSGYRLFKREVIDNVKNRLISRNFEFYPEVILRASRLGFSISEVPITFKFRVHGKSKLGVISSGIGYAKLLCLLLISKEK